MDLRAQDGRRCAGHAIRSRSPALTPNRHTTSILRARRELRDWQISTLRELSKRPDVRLRRHCECDTPPAFEHGDLRITTNAAPRVVSLESAELGRGASARRRARRGRARRSNARSRSAGGRWSGQHPHDHSARLHRRRDEGGDQQGWLTTSTSTARNLRHPRGVSATVKSDIASYPRSR